MRDLLSPDDVFEPKWHDVCVTLDCVYPLMMYDAGLSVRPNKRMTKRKRKDDTTHGPNTTFTYADTPILRETQRIRTTAINTLHVEHHFCTFKTLFVSQRTLVL